MSKIIAIDLGTTTSEVAYMKDGRPEIIKNTKYGVDSGSIIPSVVTIKKDDIIVGEKAKRQLTVRPECTVSEVKRYMGTDKKYIINDEEYIPEQISAMILRQIKEIAEEELGDVEEAIITVPANFNDTQRNATKNAAAIAGLKVERIINEPTAAALGYGLANMEDESNILVYDLGGGTFDCTVLEMFAGIMDVKASRGDNELGGKDFDTKIEEYILEHIKNTTLIDIENLDIRKLSAIKDAAEIAKKNLSKDESTEIMLYNFDIDEDGNSIDIELDFTRDTFDAITRDLIERCADKVEETLEAAGVDYSDIDVVLAVGGSSRMKAVQDYLINTFGEDRIQKGINPDEAVVLGAAVQAGIKSDEISSETGLIVTDACNNTLGTDIIGKIFSPIINRDVKLPCKASECYFTVHENQTSMHIGVYQGESEFVKKNTFIGEFELSGIPKAPAGQEEVEVTFEYDLNENLHISAKILSTGKIEERLMSTKGLSKNDLDDLAKKTFANDDDNDEWKENELFAEVELGVTLAESKLENLSEADRQKIKNKISQIKDAVLSGNKADLNKLDEELTDLLFDLE